jgi:hypothetical protein
MTPEKRAIIKVFVENEALAEAVRDVMLASVTGSTLEQQIIDDADLLLDDAVFGQHVRAKAKAVGYVKRGFAQLQLIANDSKGVQSKQNEAR